MRSASSLRVVVTGLIAQHPSLGGVAWDYVQYPAGLARLGHDVYYLEDSGQWPYRLDGGQTRESRIAYDPSANVRHLAAVMDRFHLHDHWMYRFPITGRWYGLSAQRRREVLATADLLINVSGTLRRPDDYRVVPRLAYIDSDPVFTQVRLRLPRGERKFQKRFSVHDVAFTFGERICETDYADGIPWRPTRQPVLLSEWRPEEPTREVFTTVLSWTSYRPLHHRGRWYGQKDLQLRRYLRVAAAVRPIRLELALGGTGHAHWETPGGGSTRALGTPEAILRRAGWRVAPARRVVGGLDRYRRYIATSKAEWSVAKHGYVAGGSGWFSCRSACYLAAGRPVVVEDTGFTSILPAGEGIVPFCSPDEAVEAVRDVSARYPRHARAARALAAEYFDSDRVLARLVEEAMSARRHRFRG
jgi:hypothetical protein